MSKTPEQMAEEYGTGIDLCCGTSDIIIAAEKGFLAGYKAAKDQLADTGKVMNSSKNSNDWISVKDRLPEINQEVLISYGKKPFLLIAFLYHPQYPKKDVKVFCGTNNTNYSLEYVTHWMPLPEPPRKTK